MNHPSESSAGHVTPRTSGLAIGSLIGGILGFFTLGVSGLVGVILGHLALSKIKGSKGAMTGGGLAIAGLITGYLTIAGGIILGLAMVKLVGGVADSARTTRVEADFISISSALQMYQITTGQFPTTEQGLEALVEKPSAEPQPERWSPIMDQVPLDPWENAYIYRMPGTYDSSTFELISKGPDGVEGTGDDIRH